MQLPLLYSLAGQEVGVEVELKTQAAIKSQSSKGTDFLCKMIRNLLPLPTPGPPRLCTHAHAFESMWQGCCCVWGHCYSHLAHQFQR